jgi:hypothetical protein
MANPVMDALTLHKANELRERDRLVAQTVQVRLGVPPSPPDVPSLFLAWCERHRISALPAKPAAVALFIMQAKDISVDALCELVAAISRAHVRHSDPTASWMVRQAFVSMAGDIPPPNSWPKTEWQFWNDLPYQVKRYLAPREKGRDSTVRRAQNESADWRRKLKEMEKKNEVTAPTAA